MQISLYVRQLGGKIIDDSGMCAHGGILQLRGFGPMSGCAAIAGVDSALPEELREFALHIPSRHVGIAQVAIIERYERAPLPDP
jgi:hypothetical protein